jgi:lipid-binding SYLF domain-containing protein
MNTLIRLCIGLVLALGGLAAVSPALAQNSTLTPEAKEKEQKERLQLAADGLEKLYKLQPDSKATLEKGAGYAVFVVNSVYAIMFVGQRGKGVLFDNATKQPTYMSSTRAGTGPGVGKQKVYQVFVFKDRSAMEQFMLAGGAGGDLGASVSTGTGGMTRSFNPSIDIYQIPESGLALQASWGGTVYTVDSELR